MDFVGWRAPVGIESRTQPSQLFRLPLFALESRQQQRESLEIFPRIGNSFRNLADSDFVMRGKSTGQAECSEHEPAASIECEVVHKAGDHQEAEDRRSNPCGGRMQQAWACSPAFHPLGTNSGPHIITENG